MPRRIVKIKIVRYFGIGAVAAFVNIGIFFIFAKLLGLHYVPVGIFAFVVATLVNYFLSIKHVFVSGSRFGKNKELLVVYAVSLVGLFIDLSTLYLCIDFFSLEIMLSKIIATGATFFWNYFIRKYYVFRSN